MTNPIWEPPPRVLLVEDEVMVAMYIEDVLTDLGCKAISLATNLSEALILARAERFDFAVLDINLGGGDRSYPVADILRERNTPFLFISGYSSGGLSEDDIRLRKPFRVTELAEAIERLQAV